MIELRWLEYIEGRERRRWRAPTMVGERGCYEDYEEFVDARKLQYRVGRSANNDGVVWSKWTDVPVATTAEETKDGKA